VCDGCRVIDQRFVVIFVGNAKTAPPSALFSDGVTMAFTTDVAPAFTFVPFFAVLFYTRSFHRVSILLLQGSDQYTNKKTEIGCNAIIQKMYRVSNG